MWDVVAVVSAYLAGSVPFAFIAGKMSGRDLRKVGTGNLGTHNVFNEVGKAQGVVVFFLDCAKIGLTLLVLRMIGLSLLTQSLGALAVIAGHNWSIFTGFHGGRGMTVTLVGAAILLPWETLIVLGVIAFGVLVGALALYCGFALVLWPMLALWRGESAPLLLFAFGALVLGLIRRLQGSPAVSPLPTDYLGRKDLILSRLLYDREYAPPWLDKKD